MTQRKHRFGLLGVLAVAALVMAVFASSAQALVPQIVFVNKEGKEVLALKATIGAEQVGNGTLLVPALNLEIVCERFTLTNGIILDDHDAHGNLLFENCNSFEMPPPTGKLAALTSCHVSDVAGGKPDLLHITASTLTLPIEFASGDYGLLFEKIVATVNFLSGLGCPLPLKAVIKGEVCGLIEPEGVLKNESVRPELLFSEAIQKACPERKVLEDLAWPPAAGFKDKLLYGLNEAFIDATAKIFLTGAHEGFGLGVLLK